MWEKEIYIYTISGVPNNFLHDITLILFFFFYLSEREVDKIVAWDPAIFTFRGSDPAITSLAFGLRFTR